jgi:hypothetical protein
MAANPERGEVEFEADDNKYVVRFGMNEICVLEEEHNLSISELLDQLQNRGSMRVIRSVFRAAITPEVSLEDAGRIIDKITAAQAIGLLMQAMERSFMRGGDDAANPRKAGGRTSRR